MRYGALVKRPGLIEGTTAADGPACITVAQLARLAKVPVGTVRYYTRIGLLLPERNSQNRYRLFTTRDAARLRFIRRAQLLGLSLPEIATILSEAARGKAACPGARDILQRRIHEVGEELEHLISLRDTIRRAIARWECSGARAPNGDEINRLIDSAER